MSDSARYESPLATRYASPGMQRLWSDQHRIGLWRRLWLALATEQRKLGLAIPEQALKEMAAHLDDVDLDKARGYERRFRHDVMAHIHAFGDQAPGTFGSSPGAPGIGGSTQPGAIGGQPSTPLPQAHAPVDIQVEIDCVAYRPR